MNATEYMTEWRKYRVWERLLKSKHQERLKNCAALVVGHSVIDVGCALGHSTDHMARMCPGTWAGMDFDAGSVIEAKALFPQYEFFYSQDYDMLRATEGRLFDTVICSEVIEHVPDDKAFVQGLRGLARQRLVLTTPSKPVRSVGHLRLYTEKTLAQLFAGMSPRIKARGPFFYIVIDCGGIK